jgi:hypothetical protein
MHLLYKTLRIFYAGFSCFSMRRKLLKIGTEGVWPPAASGTTSAQDFPSEVEK